MQSRFGSPFRADRSIGSRAPFPNTLVTPDLRSLSLSLSVSESFAFLRLHRSLSQGRTAPMREMKLQDLKSKTPAELTSFAEEHQVENASTLRKQELMFFGK